jgi:hypothetical protein
MLSANLEFEAVEPFRTRSLEAGAMNVGSSERDPLVVCHSGEDATLRLARAHWG